MTIKGVGNNKEYDFIIVGSGFGGSVSAMRLAQKGYKVAILEMGKRYRNEDFPKTNWNLPKYLWAPLIKCFGIQKITLLKKVMVLHGIGVGGGSLIYANVLMKAKDHIFDSKYWPKDIDWASELVPFYETATKMLGVVTNPVLESGEQKLKQVGEKMGVADTFHPTEVGVFFGKENEKVPDPYFCGAGPERVGCDICGACMIGCPNGAKNTLDKNYLYFAEKWGVEIFPETKVTKIIPGENGYILETKKSTSWFGRSAGTYKTGQVVLSAGVLGSIELLLQNKEIYRTLPNISDRLGDIVRTNNESLLGATSFNRELNLSRGIAIGAAIHPDKDTKIEGVRYPAGSDLLRFLAVPLTPNGNWITRPFKLIWRCLNNIPSMLRLIFMRDWAFSSMILLVMQSVETNMRLSLGRTFCNGFRKGIKGKARPGSQVPSYIPVAQKAGEILAEEIDGFAQNIASEVLLDTPATAHILGGAILGNSPEEGVVDNRHEVFGYKGLYICDASVIPSNLAVNPSLTITALAERFTSKIPLKKSTLNGEELFSSREVKFRETMK